MNCYYCGASELTLAYSDQFHKVDTSFGPFSLTCCRACGSMGTANPPSPERLASFYKRYNEFRPDWYNIASDNGALAAQYAFYAKHVTHALESADWIDVGAGHGEVATIVSAGNPNGLAIDIGPRPAGLCESVEYQSIDMNRAGWHGNVGRKFRNVFSVAVWEHVLDPQQFAAECLQLLETGGRLTLVCPDYGSLARRVLNQSWPYFEPGEHISIPTRKGAQLCLQKSANALNIDASVSVSSLNVGYSLNYLFTVLRMKPLANLIPAKFSIPVPTGILSAVVISR